MLLSVLQSGLNGSDPVLTSAIDGLEEALRHAVVYLRLPTQIISSFDSVSLVLPEVVRFDCASLGSPPVSHLGF